MTAKQFNDKYKDYLEEGFYGLEFDIPQITTFLDALFEEFTKIPNFKYSQIKVKFGLPRFYCCLNATTRFLVEDGLDKLLKIATNVPKEPLNG